MLNQFDPTVQLVIRFLQLIKVKVNDSTVNESLRNHPDWPSMLCITDCLTKWNVPNAAGSINPYDIDQMPTPFLARVGNPVVPLLIVLEVSEAEVHLYNAENQTHTVQSKADFVHRWSGIYLIAEPGSESGEADFELNRRKSLFKRLIPAATLAGLIGLFVTLASHRISAPGVISALGLYTQVLIMFTGVVISTLLVWYEIDKNNPFLKKVCSGLAKNDCNAILTSKQSKVFSWLSWSEVGFFYFAGGLLTLLLSRRSITEVIALIAGLNLLALPYTLFSFYYQGKVAKQWCMLCLAVQSLLLLGALNVYFNRFLTDFIALDAAVLLKSGFFFLLPALVWFSLKPYVLRLQEGKDVHRQYLRLKYNKEVLSALLKKQKRISHSVEGIGLNFGSKEAKNTIIKVCNMYCGPCSNVHPEIERLLELNSDLQVKIIYSLHDLDSDPSIKPTRHIMALAKHANLRILKNALNDWHSAKKKDYDQFAARHPMNEELLNQADELAAMDKWCRATGITHTPTFFINGFELPDTYSVQDMQYFLCDATPVGKEVV